MGYKPPVDYNPCPICGSTHGMGLTTRHGYGFVWHPACGAEGPKVEINMARPTEHDRAAIEAWNNMPPNEKVQRDSGGIIAGGSAGTTGSTTTEET